MGHLGSYADFTTFTLPLSDLKACYRKKVTDEELHNKASLCKILPINAVLSFHILEAIQESNSVALSGVHLGQEQKGR